MLKIQLRNYISKGLFASFKNTWKWGFTLFEEKIYNMIPIFDMKILRHEITIFYQNIVEKGNPISIKHYDHMDFLLNLDWLLKYADFLSSFRS